MMKYQFLLKCKVHWLHGIAFQKITRL